MAKAKLLLPKSALGGVLDFAHEIEAYCFHDKILIDCGEKRFVSPFAMLFTGAKIAHFKKRYPKVAVSFINQENHEYLAHMGFFRLCGESYGRQIENSAGSTNYLPITCIKRSEFYESETDKYTEIQDLIQRHVDRLAMILVQNKSSNPVLFDVISFSVREMMRNVFEHSQSDSLYFCAQFWPKSNKVEFSIIDFGVGIRRALQQNPNFKFDSDKLAIEWSLLPNVSGKTHLPRRSDNWFNSGYGLFMTSSLARCGGNFVLVSGSTGIELTSRTKLNFNTAFPGTAVRMNLDVTKIGSVPDRLAQFRDEAKAITADLRGTANRPPSAMSLLLRRPLNK